MTPSPRSARRRLRPGGPPNVLVAQSGGPSPVINASLQGILEAARDRPDRMGRVFAARHGVEGLLRERMTDLSSQPEPEIRLLRTTPGAGAIGSCRYRLAEDGEEDLQRALDVLRAHRIGFFFYIGGNDSMDTAWRISERARARGDELVVVGVPKTIDNDLGDEAFRLIDHTPGYGSAARYWAHLIQTIEEENRGMRPSEPVCVLQAMGRKAGFLPAAARLADPERRMPLLLGLPEADPGLDALVDRVHAVLAARGRCIVVVSEGLGVGPVGEAFDGFGHIEYGASRTTVAQIVTNRLNELGLRARGQATGQTPGVLQRSAAVFASVVDIKEAAEVGRRAVEIAARDGGGWMATILRAPGTVYRAEYDKTPLPGVARSFRSLPRAWLADGGFDVSDAFIRYAMPLIGDRWPDIPLEAGRQRFARLVPAPVSPILDSYVPLNWRRAKGPPESPPG